VSQREQRLSKLDDMLFSLILFLRFQFSMVSNIYQPGEAAQVECPHCPGLIMEKSCRWLLT